MAISKGKLQLGGQQDGKKKFGQTNQSGGKGQC